MPIVMRQWLRQANRNLLNVRQYVGVGDPMVKNRNRVYAAITLFAVVSISVVFGGFEGMNRQAAPSPDNTVKLANVAEIPRNANSFVAGELIVGLDGAGDAGEEALSTIASAESELADCGLNVAETLATASEHAGPIILASVADGSADRSSLQEAANRVAALPGVAFVQPNYRYSAASTEAASAVRDADADKQWYLNSWDADSNARGANVVAAWGLLEGQNLATVDVAVLDTGAYSMTYESGWTSEGRHQYENGEIYYNQNGGYDSALFHQEFDANNLDMNHGIDFVYRDDGGNFIWDGPIVDKYNPYGDDNGHGTHVSAIIAARAAFDSAPKTLPIGMAGISQTARIIPMKVLDNTGSGVTADFIRAYEHLIAKKEDGTFPNLRIVNMSFSLTEESDEEVGEDGDSADGQSLLQVPGAADESSGGEGAGESDDDAPSEPPDDFVAEVAEGELEATTVEQNNMALQSVVSRAAEHGIVTVCACGNEGSTAPVSPADLDDCISVTALDKDGCDAAYSNRNAKSDISAPGTDIYSAWASQADAYRPLSGTSQATAIVSGVLSLLWAANPELSVDQVKEAVFRTAHAESNTSPDVNGSFGAIDAAAALAYVSNDVWQGVPEKLIGNDDDEGDDDGGDGNGDDPDDASLPLTSAKVVFEDALCVYTGKPIKPEPIVMLNDEELDQDDDFVVQYLNNVNPGTATALVKGVGEYTGSRTALFRIALGRTNIKKVKPAKRAFVVTWSRQKCGNVGYQIRYSTKKNMKGASQKTVSKNKATKLKVKKAGKKKLKRKKRYYVQIRTYKRIGTRTYYSVWSSKRSVRVK